MNTNTCCFIGHRTINKTKKLRAGLTEIIEQLIAEGSRTHIGLKRYFYPYLRCTRLEYYYTPSRHAP